MIAANWQTLVVATSYLAAATLFLLGLQRMASPATARSGIQWAGIGMVIATVATFVLPGLHNYTLIVVALVLGTVSAWVWGKKVAITDMPQPMGGQGGGANPGWLLRAGMASCTATVIAMRAALLGIELRTLEVSVESESDARGLVGIPEVSSALGDMRMAITIGADGIDAARLTCPIGLPGIAGREPEVIAIATLAQLLMLRKPE